MSSRTSLPAAQPDAMPAVTTAAAVRGLSAIRHMDYVVIFARDLPAMRRFYETVMRFPLHRNLFPQWSGATCPAFHRASGLGLSNRPSFR